MEKIPDDLLVEILSRLPAKSLLLCMSVSKQWRCLICSSDFIRIQTLRSAKQTPNKLLIRHRDFATRQEFYTIHSEERLPLSLHDGYADTTPIPFPFSSDYEIVGSCNGVLCLHQVHPDHNAGKITLFNPSVRRKLTLPVIPKYHFVYNNFFPIPSCRAFGFGFDPITGDYKLVRISYYLSCVIYTTKAGSWRKISPPTTEISTMHPLAGFVNGTMHWVAALPRETFRFCDLLRCTIITFVMTAEVFGTMSLPECLQEVDESGWTSIQPTTFRGSLAVFCVDKIWAMKDYDDDTSWVMVYKLENLEERHILYRIWSFVTNGDLLLSTNLYPYYGIFRTCNYNHVTGEYSEIVEFNSSSCKINIDTFGESIALINGEAINCSESLALRKWRSKWLAAVGQAKQEEKQTSSKRGRI